MSTPSLALIPTGFKAGKVYSVLPESGVGDFTFTRASEATRINSAGLLEVEATGVPRLEYPLIDGVVNGCPSLLLEPQATNLITYPISFGNPYWTKSGATIEGDPSTAGAEQVVNGDFATDTDWTKGTGWSIGGGVASCDGTQTAITVLNQIGTYTINKTYKITYTIVSITTGSIDVRFQGGGATVVGANRTTSGTYTDYLTSTGNTSFRFRANSTFIGTIDNVSVKEVQGYSSPSVDFPTSAFKLVEDTSTGRHETQAPSSSSGDLAFSFFAKKGENSFIQITNGKDASAYANFDLNLGVVGSSNVYTPTIIDYGNGWYRCIAAINAALSINYARIGLITSSTSARVESYTGDGTSGVYLFMSQLEQGSYATSPTLTSLSAEGTTTTRVAETCTGAGNASTFNDSEGVLMAQISALANDGTYRMISISDGTVNNATTIQYSGVSNTIRTRIENGGLPQADITYIISSPTALNKIAVLYKSNQFELWSNGFKVGEDTIGTPPSGINKLSFDRADGLNPFYGKTSQIQYFQTVLTSAELETLTSWTSFIAMANAQNYNII